MTKPFSVYEQVIENVKAQIALETINLKLQGLDRSEPCSAEYASDLDYDPLFPATRRRV